MSPQDRETFMKSLLLRLRTRQAWAVNNMELWSALCGRCTANYGRRMPDNLTEHALIMGVLTS